MALTAVEIATAPVSGVPLQIPRVVASGLMALATGNQGFSFTQSDQTFKVARFLEVGADADFSWADTDQAAQTTMRLVKVGTVHRLQMNPGATISYFIRCAANANVVVTVEK